MILSFRTADILDMFEPPKIEVGMDFHYSESDNCYHLFIYDPSGLSTDIIRHFDGGLFIPHLRLSPIEINKLNFKECKGDFNDDDMATVHEIIDDYMARIIEKDNNIIVKEDHVYRNQDGSKYIVLYEITNAVV